VWIAGTRGAGLANYRANLSRMAFGEDDLLGGGSDALLDALVAGDAATAAKQLRAHLDAGASHLVVNAVPNAERLPILTALAPS
jgi:DNA-binding GntR family transcriptional regulator